MIKKYNEFVTYKLNENAIPHIGELIRMINTSDMIGIRKTLNDIVVQYKEGGKNQQIIKYIISYINNKFKSMKNDPIIKFINDKLSHI